MRHYTNASVILREDFRDTEDLERLFSGWDAEHRQWYEPRELVPYEPDDQRGAAELSHRIRRFEHPRCVYQVLKRHFSRYTPEMVERACGVPQAIVLQTGRDVLLGVRS